MSSLARYTQALFDLDTYWYFTDGTEDQADTSWVDTVTDSGTVTMGDARKGIVALVPSDGTVADNDEAYFATPNEIFKFTADKAIYGRCLLQFTEANTDDANVAFGFQNAVGANSILDNGAGLKVSGDTVGIYKVDGETVWRCVSVTAGGTATVTQSGTTAGGASYQLLEILIEDHSSTQMQVSFKVDGATLKDSNGITIKHFIAIASSTEMQCFVGVKNGGANNLETLNVDYIYCHQRR